MTLSQSTLDWGVIDVATLINGASPMSVTLTASWSWEKGSPIQRRNWFYIDGPVEFNTTRGDIPYTGLFYKSDNPSLGFAQTKAGKTFYSPGSLQLPTRLRLPEIKPDSMNRTVQSLNIEFTPFLLDGDMLYGSGQTNLIIDIWTNIVESS